ncbi:sorbosone dehydrogenase family protein [Dyadobacter sp. CY356]|uniref:PQQ-dependent sugar dehydrogenase n=1 Tax=Dyadobacter sp. CY356 TaxID=2906442 RepID=UPI001F33C8F8|nr:PQQ-dependent sugar dehydrogenase [Dyadobacter sp. CY356]MCF0056246.1 PQQ-dependent sugar dehydrogenase [Dyadobacter sp. CY356]
MKNHFISKMLIFALLSAISLNKVKAQKGLPSKQPFTATINTSYPQHLNFKESMVSNLKVPPGFKTSVVASGLGKPRIMVLSDNGSLYVTRRDVGDILMLTDKDGDGNFEDLKTVWAQFPDVHGITIHDGYMYLASSKILKRGKIGTNGMLTDTSTLIKDLPEGGQHDNRMISFGADGLLYMTVGSTCNDCGETNKENATMLVMNADGTNRRIFSRGLRNTIGFDWHPQTKEIWGIDNGTDWRGDGIPPEELNKIEDGADYGWPWVFGMQEVDPTREDPTGTTKEAYAKNTKPAIMTFAAHSAPIDFRFIGKTAGFSAEFQNDALVAWHGSWNRKNPEGYKIQRIHFVNGKPASVHDFFSGFLSADGKTRFGRPAGIIIDKKGKIYVSDDENGIIYCIMPAKS